MRNSGRFLWLFTGLVVGIAAAVLYLRPGPANAGSNDRFEDYILCTGAVGVTARAPTDGVWLLDYRSGKLLGTVIDRTTGRILGFAEGDLLKEFGIQPRQNVHFLMTTGQIAQGQAALYVAETTTGKFAVYTLQPRLDGTPGPPFQIRRHDLVPFRQGANGNG
jgi:hypothetical protein